jgi:hypothetical protein
MLKDGDGQTIASFMLPSLARSIEEAYRCVELASTLGSDSFMPYQSPFISPPYPKLLLFKIFDDEGNIVDIVILNALFLSCRLQFERFPDSIVPWESWGPSNTRCFLEPLDYSVHMYRVCSSEFMMDFNPIDISRGLCLGGDKVIWTEDTVIPESEETFEETLSTSLPFRMVKHRIPTNASDTHLDDCMFMIEGSDVHSLV